jgi:PadR family transcriptional regulator PadR
VIIISWKDDIVESLKFGLVDMFVLFLLSEEDMYGYQIKKEIEKRTNGVFIMKEGTLYGPLYRMEERKFISSRKVPAGARYRNYYHLEDIGREYLCFIIKSYNEITNSTKYFLDWGKANGKQTNQ